MIATWARNRSAVAKLIIAGADLGLRDSVILIIIIIIIIPHSQAGWTAADRWPDVNVIAVSTFCKT